MSDPVSTIRNLGPRSDEVYAKAGIHTASDLRALGADEAYRRLLASGSRPHFIAYYAMVMGLQGRPWNDFDSVEKVQLRARFDAIVAECRSDPDTALREDLDAVGVRL
ncbi:MAG: TfoX/Sxy family protein [Pseudomonadota bacterium]